MQGSILEVTLDEWEKLHNLLGELRLRLRKQAEVGIKTHCGVPASIITQLGRDVRLGLVMNITGLY